MEREVALIAPYSKMAFAKGFLVSFSTGPSLAASPGTLCVVCCSTQQHGLPRAFAVLCLLALHHITTELT